MNGSAAIEDCFDTGIDNVFPDPPRRRRAPAQQEPAAYSEWAGVGSGGREDGDYNLEAFVIRRDDTRGSPRRTACARIPDPVRRMIGRHLVDLVDEAGYLTGDLDAVAERLGAPQSEIEAVLAILQAFDPPGVCARNLANASRSSSTSRTASIRRCRRCWRISNWWRGAIFRRCAACAASTTQTSPT